MIRASLPTPLLWRMSRRAAPRSTPSAPCQVPIRVPDPAVLRARRAGGPVDQASYSCQCGCVFLARVSTTVACPHCGAAQPW